jgi:hypothetical protein
MLSSFTLWAKVKASQMKNDKLVHIRKYGPACYFSSARAFTFAQRVKELNIVGIVDAEINLVSTLKF